MDLSHDLKTLQRLDSQTKLLLIIFLVGLFILSYFFGSFVLKKDKVTSTKAYEQLSSPPTNRSNNLSLQSSTDANGVSQNTVYTVSLDGDAKAVTARLLLPADAVIDPASITAHPKCPVVTQNAGRGSLVVTVAVSPDDINGYCSDVLFSFRLSQLPTQTPFIINFDQDPSQTIVAAGDQNIVGTMQGGSFNKSIY